MKKGVIIIWISMLATTLFCCKKRETAPPAPTINTASNNTNQFLLSFDGKSYDASDQFTFNDSGIITNITPAGYYIQVDMEKFYSPSNSFLCNITCDIAGHFQCNFSALSDSNSDGLGTFTVLNSYYLIDSTASDAIYTMGSTSSITITENDSAWIAGTMNLNMASSGGTNYPATGSFRISVKP